MVTETYENIRPHCSGWNKKTCENIQAGLSRILNRNTGLHYKIFMALHSTYEARKFLYLHKHVNAYVIKEYLFKEPEKIP